MSKKSEIETGNSEMYESELAFSSRVMRNYIAPPGSADSKGERILKAARDLRWKYSRAKHVWYADESVSIKPRELRKLEELSGVQYGKQEVDELDHLISRADALMEGNDPDFYRPFRDAVRQALRLVAGART